MSTKVALQTVWHGPDDLWRRIASILGPEKGHSYTWLTS